VSVIAITTRSVAPKQSSAKDASSGLLRRYAPRNDVLCPALHESWQDFLIFVRGEGFINDDDG
jgi:hypothetical protein